MQVLRFIGNGTVSWYDFRRGVRLRSRNARNALKIFF
ncbi:hypothetical protein X975_15632, partial [Stegodyphus mimosarum]